MYRQDVWAQTSDGMLQGVPHVFVMTTNHGVKINMLTAQIGIL